MSDVNIFGPLVTADDVSAALVSTMQTWANTYLERMCRHVGQPAGWLPYPGSYVYTNDPHYFPEDQPPVVVIAIPGTVGTPIKQGDKTYRAGWDVRLTTFVQANDRDATERLARYYGAAFRELLLQKRSLGGFAAGIDWHGEDYGVRVSDRDQRTLGSAELRLCVDVYGVVKALGGPTAPIISVPADPPTVTTTNITFTANPVK